MQTQNYQNSWVIYTVTFTEDYLRRLSEEQYKIHEQMTAAEFMQYELEMFLDYSKPSVWLLPEVSSSLHVEACVALASVAYQEYYKLGGELDYTYSVVPSNITLKHIQFNAESYMSYAKEENTDVGDLQRLLANLIVLCTVYCMKYDFMEKDYPGVLKVISKYE